MTTQVKVEVPVMADLFAKGKKPEYLFWVGSAGAFDDRYKKVTQTFVHSGSLHKTTECFGQRV